MNKFLKIAFALLCVFGAILGTAYFIQTHNIAVLNPKGLIAEVQKELFLHASLLMFIVVIPVFFLSLYFAWEYHESNKKAKYSPEWSHSLVAEIFWWGVPFIIVIFLAIITWTSSHRLDPFRPLTSDKKPLTIQAVALNWKWLFIYPEQKIATVNWVQFPEQIPLNFQITADAPMNSFWIPQLGGQIYAMPGMKSQLHLIANETGTFRGSSANISGEGFAGMYFSARSSTEGEFEEWVSMVRGSSNGLGMGEYNKLVEPSSYVPASYYVLEEEGLFDHIIMKYMSPK